jgi:hypothetical protein
VEVNFYHSLSSQLRVLTLIKNRPWFISYTCKAYLCFPIHAINCKIKRLAIIWWVMIHKSYCSCLRRHFALNALHHLALVNYIAVIICKLFLPLHGVVYNKLCHLRQPLPVDTPVGRTPLRIHYLIRAACNEEFHHPMC